MGGETKPRRCPLNGTELRLLEQLVEGETRAAAARAIGLSPGGVSNTVHRMLSKAGAHNIAHLTSTALRNGWIPMTDATDPTAERFGEPECKTNVRAFLRAEPGYVTVIAERGTRSLTVADLTRLLERDDYAEQTRLELAMACARYRGERDDQHIRADRLQAHVAQLEHERLKTRAGLDKAKQQLSDAPSGLSPIVDQTAPSPTANAAMDMIFGDRIIRRGAEKIRELANQLIPEGRRARFHHAVADWLDSWAELEVSEHGPHADDWEHARKVSCAFLSKDDA